MQLVVRDGKPVLGEKPTYNNDDYQGSCYNVNISSTGVITATCDNYGTPASASINSCDCAGRIRNIGGKLVCQ